MPFINGFWTEPPKVLLANSIKINPKDISLTFIRSNDVNKEFKITFTVTLFSSQYDFHNPSIASKIDKKSLGDAIFNSIYEGDKDYVVLESFSFLTATFRFLWKKWFNDSLVGVTPKNHISKFERTFSFKRQLPRMISYNFNPYSGSFLVNRFKELTSERKMHNWFDGFIPKSYQDKINVKISNMFDYQYDYQENKMILRLMNIYIFGILFAIGSKIVDTQQSRKQPYIKIDFDKKVKDKAVQFDKSKWEKFIRQRFI
jgi:hypothetical protein